MQSLLVLSMWTWAVTAVAYNDKVKIPVGVLYRSGEEDIVKSIKTEFSRNRQENYTIRVIEQNYDLSSQIDRKVCTLLGRGITILITSLPFMRNSDALLTISNTYHLPVINLLGSEYGNKKSHYDLSMMMSTVKAGMDMISFYGWKSAIYIRDRANESGSLLNLLEESSYDINLELIIGSGSPKTILESVAILSRNFDKQLNIILDVPLITIYSILPILLTEYNERMAHFLITRPVDEEFWKKPLFKNEKVKLTTFSMTNRTEYNLPMSDESLLAEDASKVIYKAMHKLYSRNASFVTEISINNTKKLSNCKVHPPIPWVHGLTIARALKEVQNCHGYTGNIQFDSRGRRRIFTLNVLETSQFETKKIGTWSDKTGLTFQEPVNVFPEKTSWPITESKEYPNRKLIITSILIEPYLMKKDHSYVGYCKDLIDILSEKLNFEYTLRIVQDGKYGSFNNSNKKWTGMIGEILSEKADLAVAPLLITSERSKVVSFTTPFKFGGITLLLKKSYSAQSDLLLRPFSMEVWIFILIGYAIFGAFLFSFSCFISKSFQKMEFIHQKQYYAPRSHRSLCCRSWTVFIGRSVCLIFTVAILSLYIAKLSVIMSNQGRPTSGYELLSTKEIFELSVRTGTPKMLLLKGSAFMKHIQKSQQPLYSQHWKQISHDPNLLVDSYSEALERVSNSNEDVAFLMEATFANYIASIHCNSFAISKTVLNTQRYSMALRSDFPLRIPLDNEILLLQEDGTLDKLNDKWWGGNSACKAKDIFRRPLHQEEEPLRFRDICGLFYLMIISFVVIAVISIYQFLRQKYNNQEASRKADIII